MSDWQFTYTSPTGDSVTFGAGTDLALNSIDGLDGFDQARTSTSSIPRGDGAVPGQHFHPERTPVFGWRVISQDMTAVREKALKALTVSRSDEGVLSWQRPGETPRLLYCRPIAAPWPTTHPSHVADVKVAFEAADPRMYSAEGKQVTLQPYTAGGGLDYTVDYAKEFTVTGLEKSASNVGNAPAPTVLRFYGPSSGTCTAVRLTNVTTGVELEVVTDIVPGQILTVDVRAFVASTGARVVDLSGSGRYGSFSQPRLPLMIEPGDVNVLRFDGSGTTDGMRCLVNWSDCWLS